MNQLTTQSQPRQRWTSFAPSRALRGLTLAAVVLGLSGFVQAQDNTPVNRLEAQAEAFDLQNTGVASGQSRIIFYSPTTSKLPGAATVYINGRYHTSLAAGGFSPVCLPPGKVELGARQIDLQSRANKDGMDSMTQMMLQSGQSQFVRVNGDNRRNIALIPVKPADAEKEIMQTRLQIHTISRVAEAVECVSAEAPVVAEKPVVKPVRQLQLAGDTLFAFGRSDAAGLTQQGLRAIDQLAAQINAEYSQIDRVHVIGHTDPFGSDALNDSLSAQRALTIRQYIEGRRLIKGGVTSEGRGKRQLLVSTCGKVQNQVNIDCNQPNRRVTIEVTGTARQQ